MNSDLILKNPITIWLNWMVATIYIYIKNKNKRLNVGYLSRIHNSTLGVYNTIYDNVLINNSVIDDFVYIGSETKISEAKIGKFCSIGPNVLIGVGLHPTNLISTFPAFYSTRKQCQFSFVNKTIVPELGTIEIGNDVWIGANAIIFDDIKIANGAIIGAGAVVTKDVPPYTIVGGVPAKVIRTRFSESEIAKLESTKWWEKDLDWIKEHYQLFNNPISFFENTSTF